MIDLWLDDERTMPVGFNTHVKTAEEAIELIKTGNVIKISLDHDLGTKSTGLTVAKFIEEQAYYGNIKPINCFVHSQNIVGAKNIKIALDNTKRFWGE